MNETAMSLWVPESFRQDVALQRAGTNGDGLYMALDSMLREYGMGLSDLELARDDLGWMRLGANTTATDLPAIMRVRTVELARINFLRDPLAKQAIRLWTTYSLGKGMTHKAADKKAKEHLDTFWKNRANKKIFSAEGQRKSSDQLLVDGEIFFLIFLGVDADVTVRKVDPLQIKEILYDTEDVDTPILYHREWVDLQGTTHREWYQDWAYDKPGIAIDAGRQLRMATQDAVIFHVAINTLGNRGYSLLTPALDWVKAHRKFLEARASITQALARFAWKGKVKGGASQVAAMKAQLKSAFQGGEPSQETNPSPAAASYWLENDAFDLQAMKFETGAKGAYDDGRMLLHQVCAAVGIMEHYFGDPKTGNLATTKAMELPMLKMFESYQIMWEDTYRVLFEIVLENCGMSKDKWYVDIDSPPIVEKDAPAILEAIGKALDAVPELNVEEIHKMILTVLGINDPDEILARLPKDAGAGARDLTKALGKYTKQIEKALQLTEGGTR